MNTDRDNIEQWITERPDGGLSAEQRAAIDRAMSDDPALAADGARYDRLDRLLRAWRPVPRSIDWQTLAAQTKARVRDASTADADDAFDDRLRDNVPELPPVDWAMLKNRISAAVADEAALQLQRAWARRWRRLAVVSAPLAAAAVIAIAFFRSGDSANLDAPRPGFNDGPARVVVALDVPNPSGEITIAFDEQPPPESNLSEDWPGGATYDWPGSATNNWPGGAAIAIGSTAGESGEISEAALFF